MQKRCRIGQSRRRQMNIRLTRHEEPLQGVQAAGQASERAAARGGAEVRECNKQSSGVVTLSMTV